MRLRYLHLPEISPLENVKIRFGYEPALGRACAMHFIAGVNGSGKSRLLRALVELFLCMKQGYRIPFPATLVYDLGPDIGDSYFGPYYEAAKNNDAAQAQARHTIYVHRPREGQTIFIDFDYILPEKNEGERDWETLSASDDTYPPGYRRRAFYSGNNPPDSYLPRILLAYTSGAVDEWNAIFAPRRSAEQDTLMSAFNNLEPDEARQQERPPGWTSIDEAEFWRQQEQLTTIEEAGPATPGGVDEQPTPSMYVFVSPQALKLAVCAVILQMTARDFSPGADGNDKRTPQEQSIRGILDEIDWLEPVTLGLHMTIRPKQLLNWQLQLLVPLYEAATAVIGEPEPGRRRHLFFDLREPSRNGNGLTIDNLIAALTNDKDRDQSTPFDIFQRLLLLQQQGILQEVSIALRKRNLADLILYDWLSDGEQVFLGRMAFFHLLQGTEDALILLDEPDTHFNDFWKREMVDIIDSGLRENAIEVLLSTHSSIALTDAFDTEIIMMYKNTDDGSVRAEEAPINSFGASPLEIMRNIFSAPETVGQRAAEFLDILLVIARYPEQAQAVWALDTPGRTREQLRQTPAFGRLRNLLREHIPYVLSGNENPDTWLEERLPDMLRSLHRYAQWMRESEQVSMADALEVLYERLGSGYYEFEFRRRLDALKG